MSKIRRRLGGRQWKNAWPTLGCGERTRAGQYNDWPIFMQYSNIDYV